MCGEKQANTAVSPLVHFAPLKKKILLTAALGTSEDLTGHLTQRSVSLPSLTGTSLGWLSGQPRSLCLPRAPDRTFCPQGTNWAPRPALKLAQSNTGSQVKAIAGKLAQLAFGNKLCPHTRS